MDEVSGKTQISLRVPADVVLAFDEIAQTLDRDRTWVMVRAFRQYLATEGADLLLEKQGIAALNRGEGEDLEAVLSEADGIIAQAKAGNVRLVG